NQVYIHCRIAKHLWNSNATRCLACCHGSSLLDRGARPSLLPRGAILWETCVTKQDTCDALPTMTTMATDDMAAPARYDCDTFVDQVSRSGRCVVSLVTDTSVQVGPETEVVHSFLRHTTVGRGCRLINSVIEGHPEWPVVIGDHVTLINCHVRSTGVKNGFAFCGWAVDQRHTCLGDGVAFSNSRLWNAAIGAESRGFA